MSEVALLLAALAVLLGLARVVGAAATRLGQPAVVGEIACGLLLGILPSFPAKLGTTLDSIAQLGLTLFLFCVGAQLASSLTGQRVKAALVPALGAAAVPFVLGALLALWLARRHAPAGTLPFVLFVAAAMAVTAFPVLARILADRNMIDGVEGQRALSAAAITDASAWIALAVVAASLRGGAQVWTLALAVPLLLAMFGLARPWFGHWAGRLSRPATTTLMVALACACAAATDAIGLHATLGAFLVGVAVGRSAAVSSVGHVVPATLVAPVGSLLVPLYFVLIGRDVDLTRLDLRLAGETAAVIAVAVIGKLGGAYLGARLAGQPPRPAVVFATLMNTRGITELVFVSIGLGLGVIDSALYAAMVAMALVTTAMTGPLLNRLTKSERGAAT